jgi:hypothetical protein
MTKMLIFGTHITQFFSRFTRLQKYVPIQYFCTSNKKFISLPEYGDCGRGGEVRHNGAAAGVQVHTIQLEIKMASKEVKQQQF